MISPTRFLEMYIAMGLHFKEGKGYDYMKYKGQVRTVSQGSLQKRKDKYFFEKHARKMAGELDAVAYLATNFISGNTYVMKFDEKPYKEFLAYADAIEYRFEQDLEKYQKDDPVVKCYTGSTEPYIYLILLNMISDGAIFKLYNDKYGIDDILWSDLRDNKLRKYAPFVELLFHVTPEMKHSLCEKVKTKVA